MFSEAVSERLEETIVLWLTTVSATGQPQTSPVWFWWDGEEFLIYSLDPTPRLVNIDANPLVSINLDGNGTGGDIVTIEGRARRVPPAPSAAEVPEYVAKYRTRMERGWGGPEGFSQAYPAALRVRPTRVRAW